MKHVLQSATILALATAAISGVNNFLTKVAVTSVKDPIVFTTLKNAIVALGLLGILLALRKWREISALTRKQWVKLIAIGVVGGSVPFALFFTGLTKTSAMNAGLVHKTLFLWVILLAVPILKERMTSWQWFGVVLLFSANLVVGGFTGFRYNTGEFMILGATVLWAIENIIAKVALRDIASTIVAASRMTIGSLVLLLLVLWQGNGHLVFTLNGTQWAWTLLTSVLLLGYVLAWYAALARAPASYVATLLVPATLVTNVLSAIFITRTMSGAQAASAILFILGILLVVFSAKRAAVFFASSQSKSHSSLSS